MYFRTLQVLRGLAAVAVVLYHVGVFADTLGGNPHTIFRFFDERFAYGAWFFFTLSGFLMAYLVDTAYPMFLRRRLLRIYPTYWAAVAIVVVARSVIFRRIDAHKLHRALFLLPLGMRVDYPLWVEWTLVYEVFFYLVCAAFATGRLRRALPYFLAAWGAAIVAAWVLARPDGWLGPRESWLLPRGWHIAASPFDLLFIGGGLTYHAFTRLPHTSRGFALVGAAASVACFVAARRVGPAVWNMALLSASFSFAVYSACLADRTSRDRAASRRAGFFERLGDRSYGLYLIHVPVISTILLLACQGRDGKAHHVATTALCAGAAAAALFAGWWFGRLDLLLHDWFKRQTARASRAGGSEPVGAVDDRPLASAGTVPSAAP